jgi:hypothetical protein
MIDFVTGNLERLLLVLFVALKAMLIMSLLG